MPKLGDRLDRKIAALASLLLLAPSSAFAATTGLPWEAPLDTVINSISGPVVTGLAAVAVIFAGLVYAFGEAGGMMRRSVGIVAGLAIAVAAPGLVADLFGVASGMPF